MKKRILIVDDDPDILLSLADRLIKQNYEVVTAEDGLQALERIEQDTFSLILLDLQLPTLSGLELLQRLQFKKDIPPVIILTAFGSIEQAVQAIKRGAYDYILKPFAHEYLLTVIEKALNQDTLKREAEFWRTEVDGRYETIIAESSALKSILELAARIAPTNSTVLLLGETGTGKELISRAIHRWSPRQSHPFMVINCTTLPEHLLENELFGHEKGAFTGASEKRKGKMEAAEGGTVFLDEIGDMPLALQGRLLRLLQDREFYRLGGNQPVHVDVRFIAATNKDLPQCVKAGTFREDLFYRLNSFPILLPPLRERMTDLPVLAQYILEREGKESKLGFKPLSQEAMVLMLQYSWPGNIRELENVLARALILCDKKEVGPELICLGSEIMNGEAPVSGSIFHSISYHESMEQHSKALLLDALRQSGWNQTKAAGLLKLNRTYLTKLLKQKAIPTKLAPLDRIA